MATNDNLTVSALLANSELETPITCLHPRAEWLLRGANLHDEADSALSLVAAAVAVRAETPSENQ